MDVAVEKINDSIKGHLDGNEFPGMVGSCEEDGFTIVLGLSVRS